LLEDRFGPLARRRIARPPTIIGVESMRNAFLAQGVFVPGIATIYSELLSNVGHEVCQLQVASTVGPGELTFGELLARLYRRDRMIVIGIELVDPDGRPRVVVNPKRGERDYRFAAGALRSVFVVADHQRLSGHAHPPPQQPAAPTSER